MYTTVMPLVLPGDYWIFIASFFVISLFVVQKAMLFAYLILGVTTTIIYMHYGSARVVLHLIIMFSSVSILRLASRKFAHQEIIEDE